MVYGFWNNKGGTGKTSLAFQVICRYAEIHPSENILAIDLCPQANLSELLLGGLTGGGGVHLSELYNESPRRSVGGYFQERLPSPFIMPSSINFEEFLCQPYKLNSAISSNIDLIAGDAMIELQTNAIATLSNTQLPGTNTWLAVIDWINNYIETTNGKYDIVFIDMNPSFSIYTQIALASTDRLIVPVMADDSSRRAIQNVFSLVHGIQMPSPIYQQYSFDNKLRNAKRSLPLIHLIVKNRLTQYMGPASAYNSVLTAIDNDLNQLLSSNDNVFSFDNLKNGMVQIRDFQTTGVVAFAEGKPFSQVSSGIHVIMDKSTKLNQNYIDLCKEAIELIVDKL